eukprot:5823097-Pleurochrysis_carterae.AAC.1
MPTPALGCHFVSSVHALGYQTFTPLPYLRRSDARMRVSRQPRLGPHRVQALLARWADSAAARSTAATTD